MIFGVIIAVVLTLLAQHTDFTQFARRKIYDVLVKIQYKLKGPPAAAKDITLVVIDNETFRKMEERWPYRRASFARVIDNLADAGARAIAIDFIFYGGSSGEDDAALKASLERRSGRVILGASIDEESRVNASTAPFVAANSISGVVTKVQDPDSFVRRSLTYLLSDKAKKSFLLSWEMQVLKVAQGVDVSTFDHKNGLVSFSGGPGERWSVPVEDERGTFLINFSCHTSDIKKLSFYDVLKGDFDKADVKGRIVLIGFISSAFWDFYNTPIGPLPGITLNANALLTLYTRAFITRIPPLFVALIVMIGAALASVFAALFRIKTALIFIAAEIALFFALSLLLLLSGYAWDYALFPAAVLVGPLLGKKITEVIA